MAEALRLAYAGEDGDLFADRDGFAVATVDATMDVLGLLETDAIDCVVCDGDATDWRGLHDRLRDRFLDVGFVLYADADPETIDAARRADVDRFVPRAGGEALLAARVRDCVAEARSDEEGIRDARFHALAESVGFGVVTIDADSVVQFANPAVEDILGWSPEELAGESLGVLIPDRLRSEHFAQMREYLDTGERGIDWSGVELPAVHRDGHEVPVIVAFGEFRYGSNQYFSGAIVESPDPATAEPVRDAITAAREHLTDEERDVGAAINSLDRALARIDEQPDGSD